ncbi:MAG: hypothetical protein QM767_24175 [Anaeromyxobacter sp.]
MRMLAPLLLATLLTACANVQRGPLEDGKGAKAVRVEGLSGQGFCQVLLIAGTSLRQAPYAIVYDTTGLNGAAGQSCPADAWAKVRTGALEDTYHVPDALKDGPRVWTLDWQERPLGAQRDLGGLTAAWAGVRWLVEEYEKPGALDYAPLDEDRDSRQGWKQGTRVYLLEDPRGTTWVMQSFTSAFDPTLTAEGLEGLGTRLRLPPGWKFRTRVLEEDLELRAINGRVRVTQDNLRNSYAACFGMSGQKACSHQP